MGGTIKNGFVYGRFYGCKNCAKGVNALLLLGERYFYFKFGHELFSQTILSPIFTGAQASYVLSATHFFLRKICCHIFAHWGRTS